MSPNLTGPADEQLKLFAEAEAIGAEPLAGSGFENEAPVDEEVRS